MVILGLATLLFVIAICGYFLLREDKTYISTKKLLRFNYIVKNETEKFIAESRFVAAVPMQINGIQTIESINSSYEYLTPLPDSKREAVEFRLKNIAPYSSKIIDLTITLTITNKPNRVFNDADEYLQAQKYIEVDSAEIKELAAQLKGETELETAKNIHQWLVNNITVSSYTADSKGAVYAIKNKTGDCTEFMYAFMALARASGIPARGISGFWIPGDSSLINAADYHDWAEFYDGDRWVLVDSSKGIFDKSDFSYIVGSLFHPDKNMRWQFSSIENQLTVSQ